VAITDDHFPHLVAPETGVHLMFGYNGRGIAVSTASGRMVAEHILSGGAADVALPVDGALAPVPFHGFWKIGAEATMAWNRLRDTLRGR
jgi:glycine/D-amino acid oxidase-like deaminating enzyme